MKRKKITLKVKILVVGLLVFPPMAHAVVPAPDGCYPGLTTAEGCNALAFSHGRQSKYCYWLAFALFCR